MNGKRHGVFWFRRDLRLEDNAGLYHALKQNNAVIPIFIFDKEILSELSTSYDRRVDFIHQAISHIKDQLRELGSDLMVFHSTPQEAFKLLIKQHDIEGVYCNHDYEPYAIQRDKAISEYLKSHSISFQTFKDQCIFEKNEVIKDDGTPYTVFTPYSKKWKAKLTSFYHRSYPTEKYFKQFYSFRSDRLPSLEDLGFIKTDMVFTKPSLPSKDLLSHYKENRDYPYKKGTSQLSIHLRFGTISIRQLTAYCLGISETWLNELIWREFYMMILWHFPHVVTGSFKKEYDHVPWRHDEELFKKWCEGKTGYPIVDAGMRELNSTGFMHNRVRMIVSSFLVKDLLIDWRLGEAYFAQKLNDFDLSANNGGWQWAAGCGCDAAPYFRIFNPTEQQKRFDPEFSYIKKWVPEYGTKEYPLPIVDHADARKHTLQVYKNALNSVKQMQLF